MLNWRYAVTCWVPRLNGWPAGRRRDNLPGVQAAALRLTTQVEPGVSRQLEALLGKLQARSARLGQWMTLAQQGRNAEALVLAAKDLPGEPLSVLRAEFDHILDQAASAQRVVRVSLYDAMMLSRLAVHLLAMLSVVALAQCLRSLRVRDSERAQEKGRLESQLLIRTAELRQLAGHLVSAREDEPARVAKDLHDEMGGLFTAMKLALARLKRLVGLPGLALDRVKGVEARLNEGVALKRRIIENRRPSSLDPLGLRAALELLCQDVAQQSSLKVEVVVEDLPLDKELELTLYRLVQESLTNTVKNAQAAHGGVRLRARDGQADLEVQDDGQGFDPRVVRPGHHGLPGMRMRVEAQAGALAVISAPGQGTRICVQLPMSAAGT